MNLGILVQNFSKRKLKISVICSLIYFLSSMFYQSFSFSVSWHTLEATSVGPPGGLLPLWNHLGGSSGVPVDALGVTGVGPPGCPGTL